MHFPHLPAKRWSILWSLVVLGLLLAARPPDPDSPILDLGASERPPVVAAWLMNAAGGVRPMVMTVAAHSGAYSEVSAFSYTIERDGSLTANSPVTDAPLVNFARISGIKVIPTIASTWDSTNIVRVLRDPALRAKHLQAVLAVGQSPLVDGIDLDYENLPPDTRQAFTDFVINLASALHAEGKMLTVTVPSKVSDNDGCVICEFADYKALGTAADQIRVMAYEYHGPRGDPAPNAPLWWVQKVMEYTLTRVPRNKAVLGIHLYAYDWGDTRTAAYWWATVQALKERYHGEVTYVESDERGLVGESRLTYYVPSPPCPPGTEVECVSVPEKHTVWFVDSKYVAGAWDIVKELQLAGIVMWRPGGEDPEIWTVLDGSLGASVN